MAQRVWLRWFPPGGGGGGGGGGGSQPASSLAGIIRLNPIRIILELIVKSLPWEVVCEEGAWCV